ncbi:unnamed protein product, partial [Discosporangium mesarthrocarpum]
ECRRAWGQGDGSGEEDGVRVAGGGDEGRSGEDTEGRTHLTTQAVEEAGRQHEMRQKRPWQPGEEAAAEEEWTRGQSPHGRRLPVPRGSSYEPQMRHGRVPFPLSPHHAVDIKQQQQQQQEHEFTSQQRRQPPLHLRVSPNRRHLQRLRHQEYHQEWPWIEDRHYAPPHHPHQLLPHSGAFQPHLWGKSGSDHAAGGGRLHTPPPLADMREGSPLVQEHHSPHHPQPQPHHPHRRHASEPLKPEAYRLVELADAAEWAERAEQAEWVGESLAGPGREQVLRGRAGGDRGRSHRGLRMGLTGGGGHPPLRTGSCESLPHLRHLGDGAGASVDSRAGDSLMQDEKTRLYNSGPLPRPDWMDISTSGESGSSGHGPGPWAGAGSGGGPGRGFREGIFHPGIAPVSSREKAGWGHRRVWGSQGVSAPRPPPHPLLSPQRDRGESFPVCGFGAGAGIGAGAGAPPGDERREVPRVGGPRSLFHGHGSHSLPPAHKRASSVGSNFRGGLGRGRGIMWDSR